MKKWTICLLAFVLFLDACGPIPPPAPTEISVPAKAPTRTHQPPSATPRPTASPTPTSDRSAAFTLVENTVEARQSSIDEYTSASVGLTLPVGGEARTGEASRARLDLSPDSTIIRLAPNTIFNLVELKEENDDPFTLLKLLFGQIYIILSGGELKVSTPSGLASVLGSMMGVSYDPQTGTMTVTCLEGHCSLQKDKSIVALIAGQAADIIEGIVSREPRLLTDAELGDWLEFTPELRDRPELLPLFPDLLNPPNILPTRSISPIRTPRWP